MEARPGDAFSLTEAGARSGSSSAARTLPVQKSSHILITESDEVVLTTTTNLLRREGYLCTPTRDGLEAIRALQMNRYDLLITEICMPGMEDLDIVRAAHRYAQDMPVIIYTMHPSLRSAIAAIQLRVSAYLIKPVDFSLLLERVRASIANYQTIKQKEMMLARTMMFICAIEETIRVLESTRNAFKSRQLAILRRKLERLLAGQ
jgi:DNA-binding NtrC family response regulator